MVNKTTLPTLTTHMSKLRTNARLVKDRCARWGIEVTPVTKVTCGNPQVARVFVEAGFASLGDSRLENLALLRKHFPATRLMLLRLPMISQASEVVRLADISLNSDIRVLQALNQAARDQGKIHEVILMVDVGDLREGIWPDSIPGMAREMAGLSDIRVVGVGTNLACYGGICPTVENMEALLKAAEALNRATGWAPHIISGGNSANWLLMESGNLPSQVNHLRLGEIFFLGQETTLCQPIEGLCQEIFTLEAEVIESLTKPSVPLGQVMRDAFGGIPSFSDRGLRKRVIVAVGRQDVVPEGLVPEITGVEILGASSDHLILDVEEAPQPISSGDVVSFTVSSYSALLALFTSPYVSHRFVE